VLDCVRVCAIAIGDGGGAQSLEAPDIPRLEGHLLPSHANDVVRPFCSAREK
jgi:hypothetical protein